MLLHAPARTYCSTQGWDEQASSHPCQISLINERVVLLKYPPVAALSVALLLLTGCGAASQGTDSNEPDAVSSVTPSSTEPTSAEADPTTTPAETAPASQEPEDPASEPAPATTEPIVETSEPAVPAPTEQQVITPVPTFDEVQVVTTTGSTFIVTGEGYEPNDQIRVSFGIAQSDGMIVTVLLFTDGTGKYSAPIALNSDLEPGSYAVMTVPEPQRGEGLQEDAKRFASIEVVAP